MITVSGQLVIVFLSSLIFSSAFTYIVRIIAVKLNFMDKPDGLKNHSAPVPYLGGAAVCAAFFGSLVIIRLMGLFPTGTLRNLRALFYGGILISVLGLIDDKFRLGYAVKFIFQIIAALILVYFDIRIQFISNKAVSIIISVIWIVGIINSINIIDIMDGSAAGITFIAGIFFFLIALPTEHIYVNFASLALSGACLGFLRYNLSAKKIFLGDTGSLFLGFILAAISLGESYTGVNNIALFAPILILGVPIYDTFLVIYCRLKKRKSPFKASNDHTVMRLSALGFSKRKILLILYFASAVLGSAAWIITESAFGLAALVYFLVISAGVIALVSLGLVRID